MPHRPPDPVKLFVAAIWSDRGAFERSLGALSDSWGEIDFRGTDHPFDATDYYKPEMGDRLERTFVSFRRLAPSESLADAKALAIDTEEAFRTARGRRVNLDVGYLDLSKVVLASVKGLGQKIHLGRGIFADLVLRYRGGRYTPFEWTFADFRDGRYDADLLAMRRLYKAQLELAAGDSDGSERTGNESSPSVVDERKHF